MDGKSLKLLLVLMVAVVVIGTVSGRKPRASSVPEDQTDRWWDFWHHHSNKTKTVIECFKECFRPCNIPIPNIGKCTLDCAKKCGNFNPGLSEAHNSCNLDCASSKCTNISTLTNPHAAEVESCVNSCSKGCNTKLSTRP